jgi:soluble lytic murein transglycosylase
MRMRDRLSHLFLPLFLAAGCSANGNGDRGPLPASVGGGASGEEASAAGTAAPEPGAVALTMEMAQPYFAGGRAGEAAARFALEDWSGARAGFATLLAGEKDREARARLTLMVAICDARLNQHARAAAGFEKVLPDLPVMADWLHNRAARAHYSAHAADKALEHARAVTAGSISGADAELLVGDILRERGDARQVAEHYRTYLTERPSGIRLAEARYRLAEAIEKRGGAADEAFTLYRKVTVSAPLSRWASDAAERLDALLRRKPASERTQLAQLGAAEHIERGKVYFDNMRNKESEADFEAALSAPGLDDDMRCVAAFHRAQSVFKQRDRTRAAPLFDAAIPLCEKAGNQDILVKSAYQAGRSYANIGQYPVAAERYEAAEKACGSEHSYGDDARLRQAEVQLDMGNHEQVSKLLSSIPVKYPTGDMKAEATWRLAWRDYKDGKLDSAIRWLKKQIELVPVDDNYWAEGQPQYWMGRAFDRLKKPREAAAAYEQAVRLYPVSYYSLLALNRLRESHRARFDALREEIAAAPDGWDPAKPAFQFKPRALYGSPGFQRALEFLRLGLGAEAEAELRRLGLAAPAGKSRVDDPDLQDKLWAMAFLYDSAGRYAHSHWTTRWHILDFKRHWPAGPHRARWDIAYPRAWWPLLERHAKRHGFPAELIISFVREESAFDPLRESFANAIGLTQMIFPTAKRFATGTGITVNRAALRDPVKNVTIGSNFLAFLVAKFEGRFALVVPSYNAGEGATGGWLRIRGDWAMDEFAEEIPYDETRNYSKRVLASYFAYSYLKDGTIPEMPNDIPRQFSPGSARPGDASPRRVKGN